MVPLVGAAKFTTYSMLTATVAVLMHFFIRQVLGGHALLPTGAGSGMRWGYGIMLALVATVIPSFMLSAGMRRIGANNAAIVTSVGPVSTILQAHFFLGDRIFAEQVIGTALVIVGVLLIGWKERQLWGGHRNVPDHRNVPNPSLAGLRIKFRLFFVATLSFPIFAPPNEKEPRLAGFSVGECPGGEIGRRTVFRSQRSQGCAGSNPVPGTIRRYSSMSYNAFFF